MPVLRVILIVISSIILGTAAILVTPFNYKGKGVFYVYRIFAKIVLFLSGIRLEVIFKQNLKEGKEYIFVSNHLSYLDIPVLMTALPRNIRFIYKKSLSWMPIFGWAMYLGGYIPIDRTNAREAIKSLKKAVVKLNNYISVIIFPEGTRSKDGRTADFKKGAFMLAGMAKSEIVPVSIIGTDSIMPKHGINIKPGTVKVIIETPVTFKNDKGFMNSVRENIIENINLNNKF